MSAVKVFAANATMHALDADAVEAAPDEMEAMALVIEAVASKLRHIWCFGGKWVGSVDGSYCSVYERSVLMDVLQRF